MSGDARDSIAHVLALIEKHGSVVVPSRSLEKLASVDARVAFHAARVLVGAPAAASWPCEVRGCSREIRANYSGARRPLVAVCSQAPSACAPVELGFEEVAQQEISVGALVEATCALLGADVDRAALAKTNDRHPIGEARMPILVATLSTPARDVFWAASPRDMDIAAFCTRRERIARRTLLLVPTGKHVASDVVVRYAPGERVEIESLCDLLDVRDGALVLAECSEVAASTKPPLEGFTRGVAQALGVTAWEQIRIRVVDGHTVRVEGNGKSLLRTFVEFGLVDGRKTDAVTPVIGWSILLLLCKTGRFRPSEYAQFGKAFAAKKGVEVVRAALKETLGLESDPLQKYMKGWTPKFQVGGGPRDA